MNIGFTMRSAFEGAVRDVSGSASGLAAACLSNFEDMINALQTWFPVEHNQDGTHGAVTATSLAVTNNITTLGKLRLGKMVRYYNNGIIASGRIDNLYAEGLETASVLKVRISAALITITGIDATGRQPGDLLLLINDDEHVAGPGPDFALGAANTNSLEANRFIGSAASQSPWTVNGSEGVLLMYDSFTNVHSFNHEIPGWRVIARV